MGVTTEIVTKRSFTETSVKRVTKNEVKAKVEEVVLVKAGGPLGLSIIGGSDHSCVPFGTGEPGIFISKVIMNIFLSILKDGERRLSIFTIQISKREDPVILGNILIPLL